MASSVAAYRMIERFCMALAERLSEDAYIRLLKYVRNIVDNPANIIEKLLLIRELLSGSEVGARQLLDAFNRCLLQGTEHRTKNALYYYNVVDLPPSTSCQHRSPSDPQVRSNLSRTIIQANLSPRACLVPPGPSFRRNTTSSTSRTRSPSRSTFGVPFPATNRTESRELSHVVKVKTIAQSEGQNISGIRRSLQKESTSSKRIQDNYRFIPEEDVQKSECSEFQRSNDNPQISSCKIGSEIPKIAEKKSEFAESTCVQTEDELQRAKLLCAESLFSDEEDVDESPLKKLAKTINLKFGSKEEKSSAEEDYSGGEGSSADEVSCSVSDWDSSDSSRFRCANSEVDLGSEKEQDCADREDEEDEDEDENEDDGEDEDDFDQPFSDNPVAKRPYSTIFNINSIYESVQAAPNVHTDDTAECVSTASEMDQSDKEELSLSGRVERRKIIVLDWKNTKNVNPIPSTAMQTDLSSQCQKIMESRVTPESNVSIVNTPTTNSSFSSSSGRSGFYMPRMSRTGQGHGHSSEERDDDDEDFEPSKRTRKKSDTRNDKRRKQSKKAKGSRQGKSQKSSKDKKERQELLTRPNRNTWTTPESKILSRLVTAYNNYPINWSEVAAKLAEKYPKGKKTTAQCSQRWYRVINTELDKGPWTIPEEKLLIVLTKEYNYCRWAEVARKLGLIGYCRADTMCRYISTKIERAVKSAWSSEEIKYVKDYLKEQVGKKSPQRLLKELLDDELWLKIAEILKKQRFTVNAKSPYHVKMLFESFLKSNEPGILKALKFATEEEVDEFLDEFTDADFDQSCELARQLVNIGISRSSIKELDNIPTPKYLDGKNRNSYQTEISPSVTTSYKPHRDLDKVKTADLEPEVGSAGRKKSAQKVQSSDSLQVGYKRLANAAKQTANPPSTSQSSLERNRLKLKFVYPHTALDDDKSRRNGDSNPKGAAEHDSSALSRKPLQETETTHLQPPTDSSLTTSPSTCHSENSPEISFSASMSTSRNFDARGTECAATRARNGGSRNDRRKKKSSSKTQIFGQKKGIRDVQELTEEILKCVVFQNHPRRPEFVCAKKQKTNGCTKAFRTEREAAKFFAINMGEEYSTILKLIGKTYETERQKKKSGAAALATLSSKGRDRSNSQSLPGESTNRSRRKQRSRACSASLKSSHTPSPPQSQPRPSSTSSAAALTSSCSQNNERDYLLPEEGDKAVPIPPTSRIRKKVPPAVFETLVSEIKKKVLWTEHSSGGVFAMYSQTTNDSPKFSNIEEGARYLARTIGHGFTRKIILKDPEQTHQTAPLQSGSLQKASRKTEPEKRSIGPASEKQAPPAGEKRKRSQETGSRQLTKRTKYEQWREEGRSDVSESLVQEIEKEVLWKPHPRCPKRICAHYLKTNGNSVSFPNIREGAEYFAGTLGPSYKTRLYLKSTPLQSKKKR